MIFIVVIRNTRIIKKNIYIAIDSGRVYGERMGCICLENGQAFYVRKKEPIKNRRSYCIHDV